MAYASANFRTKKDLKAAVQNGSKVSVWSPGPFGTKSEGREYLEGPWYPEPHKWYAQVTLTEGMITKVV